MTDDTPQTAALTKPGPARRTARAGAWFVRHLGMLALGLPVALVLIALLAVIDREISAPSWVREQVETRVASATGGTLGVGGMSVILGSDLHPRVRLTEARLSDADGREIARVPGIELLFSPRGLVLEQTLLVQRIALEGAELAVARDESGLLALRMGSGQAVPEAGIGGALAAFGAARSRPALAALERIEASDLRVTYADARAGQQWTVPDGAISFDFNASGAEGRAELALRSETQDETAIALRLSAPAATGPSQFTISLAGASAASLATQSAALAWLSLLDADIDAVLSGQIAQDGALGPIDVSLDIGQGTVTPGDGAEAQAFHAAGATLSYDPDTASVRFDRVEVDAPFASVSMQGDAYLRDMVNGIPNEIWGQFAIAHIGLHPKEHYTDPLMLTDGMADLKLVLDPFALSLGSAVLTLPTGDLARVAGDIKTSDEAWAVALDAQIDSIGLPGALALWPAAWRPGARGWMVRHLLDGELSGVHASLRTGAGDPRLGVDFAFDEGMVRYLDRMPRIEGAAGFVQILDRSLSVSLDAGQSEAPEGGRLDLAGSSFVIPTMGLPRTPAQINIEAKGPLLALLSTVDQPPLRLLSRAALPTSLASGAAAVSGRIELPLADDLRPSEITYEMGAVLTGIASQSLVPDRALAADTLDLSATPDGIEIAGRATLDGVPLDGVFSKSFAPGTPALIAASVELSPSALDTFGISLPEGIVSGRGAGQVALEIGRGAPPTFELISDLNRIGLDLPWLGWSLPANERGRFEITGQLGAAPSVERVALAAPGLDAEGTITLQEGSFEALRLSRLRVGDWLDAGVTLANQGDGRPPAIALEGGRFDLPGSDLGGGESGGDGGPLSVALDRLDVTRNIALTQFRGAFLNSGGLQGRFGANVNDAAPIDGELVPFDGQTAVRLTSPDAGAALRASGLMETIVGGSLTLNLQPAGAPGVYDGLLQMRDIRVRDAPALAALIDAISVVGLLQQLDGQGLSFPEVDVYFRLTPDRIIVRQSSAVGASLGLSLDGTYWHEGRVMDFQGVISPLYLLNGIGAFLTRPGEGLVGFNFNLQGTPANPLVSVNPLSVLTPGMFREIFRRPVPQVE